MEKIKNLAYLGIGLAFTALVGMLIAFLDFIFIFASTAKGIAAGETEPPSFTVFLIGFSLAFISIILCGMVRLALQAMIISKGFEMGRSGIIAFFTDIIKEANKKE